MKPTTIYKVTVSSQQGQFETCFLFAPVNGQVWDAIRDEIAMTGMSESAEGRARIEVLEGLSTLVSLSPKLELPTLNGEPVSTDVNVAGLKVGCILIQASAAWSCQPLQLAEIAA